MTPAEAIAQEAAKLKTVATQLASIATSLASIVKQIPAPTVVPPQTQPIATTVIDAKDVKWSVNTINQLMRNGSVVPDSWVNGAPFLVAGIAYHEGSKGVYRHNPDGTYPLVKDPRAVTIAQSIVPGVIQTD